MPCAKTERTHARRVSRYDNVHDVVLKEVFDILQELSTADDVRLKLDSMFGLKVELKALRRTVGLKNAFEPSKVSNAASPNAAAAGGSGQAAGGKPKSTLPPVTGDAGATW